VLAISGGQELTVRNEMASACAAPAARRLLPLKALRAVADALPKKIKFTK